MPPASRAGCFEPLIRQDSIVLPFLYTTSTILCGRGSPLVRSSRRNLAHSAKHHTNLAQKPPKRRLTTIDYGSQADILPSFNANSTLTPIEYAKFRRIFEAAASGLLPPSQQSPEDQAQSRWNTEETGEEYEIGRTLDKLFAGHEPQLIHDGEGEDGGELEERGEHAQDLVSVNEKRHLRAQQRRENLGVFPEALRGAWRDVQRSAQQVARVRSQHPSRKSHKKAATGPQEELERLKEQDVDRIKALLDGASTDLQLWSTLDKEVFSRIRTLVDTMKLEKSKQQNRAKNNTAGEKQEAISNKEGGNGAGEPPKRLSLRQFAIVQGTYSTHLTNALRALRTKFPRSPYAAAVLPAVNRIDAISQVLGSSTGLYNELLYNAWRNQVDIGECARLAEEMYSQGIAADQFTTAVFVDAQRDRNRAFSSTETANSTKRQWWGLQGVKNSMRRWHAAMDLMQDRVEREESMKEEWEKQQMELE